MTPSSPATARTPFHERPRSAPPEKVIQPRPPGPTVSAIDGPGRPDPSAGRQTFVAARAAQLALVQSTMRFDALARLFSGSRVARPESVLRAGNAVFADSV